MDYFNHMLIAVLTHVLTVSFVFCSRASSCRQTKICGEIHTDRNRNSRRNL